MNQQDLFAELRSLRRSLAKLLPELPARGQDWRPRDGMRTVWELATHLVQVPAIDTLISQAAPQKDVQVREKSLSANDAAGLLAVYDAGLSEAERHFSAMSAEEFEGTVTTAFYGHSMPAKGWLLEIVTHVHHHRAMLYTCLKLMGRPVDMSHLYA